ncbi:flagellar hook-basal body complex protein FliE [Vibrio cholerae]|uniref:flagellar hook-basal body complex protein FliE n=1 Tax=Vibrio cholerae TaxID=666 RepID=UPI001E3D1D2C|nr:flagellar hook-basal body complex protein FliE [Vibrio cholerae]MCD6730484.1 flagellar hook-basal body complex protein FliE [Vibrio cholerae]
MKVEAISQDLLRAFQVQQLATPPQSMVGNFSAHLESIDNRIMSIAKGEQVELHELMIDIERAKLSLEYSVSMRDKMIDAYKEITRMQV